MPSPRRLATCSCRALSSRVRATRWSIPPPLTGLIKLFAARAFFIAGAYPIFCAPQDKPDRELRTYASPSELEHGAAMPVSKEKKMRKRLFVEELKRRLHVVGSRGVVLGAMVL